MSKARIIVAVITDDGDVLGELDPLLFEANSEDMESEENMGRVDKVLERIHDTLDTHFVASGLAEWAEGIEEDEGDEENETEEEGSKSIG